ncbi:hypothetical protein ACFLTS_00045 [Chloroflexota bacterium]
MFFDYFMLVFIGAMGVFQIAAVPARLKGLCFFGRPVLQYIFGVLAIAASFCWFFVGEERNFQHRVEGSQQLGLFLLAILASYYFTLIVASVIKSIFGQKEAKPELGRQHDEGMETLKAETFLGGIASSLRKERKSSK